MQRITILVHGRVQGVCYRDSARRKALELGLAGTVQNLPDGTVKIVAEGAGDRLEALIQWARSGPPAAVVAGLDIEWDNATGIFDTFRITS
ncbi:MAG: acylphosphatase [bacterium]|nr:acylphosphatase [bacterium]MDT8396720.1 acylphosphatase [bacterium]